MSLPQPWSHSRLSAFETCPRQFYEVQIAKTTQDVKGEAVIWGQEVHEHFEHRQLKGTPLPATLAVHEPFMEYLDAMPGTALIEDKIALDKNLQPCGFFDKNVWYRGVVDYGKIAAPFARIIDYKTGKYHTKFGQLKLFALHTFIAYPDVETVRAEYYWTQTMSTNGETYTRDQMPSLWAEFMPGLRQYAQAYRDDIWQPRQSGLCRGYCPVTACEFWSPRRKPKW